MFLKEFYEETCGMAEAKLIMEIVLDRSGLRELYTKFYNTPLSEIPYDANTTSIQSIYNYVFNKYNLSKEKQNDLKQRFIDFILTTNRDKIEYEYSKGSITRNIIKIHYKEDFRGRLSEEVIDRVQELFVNYVYKECCGKYQLGSEKIGGYLNTCYIFFIRNQSDSIYDEINMKGTSVGLGDGEVSINNLLTVTLEEDNDFTDFIKVASTICSLSESFYEHKGEVFYDIFSRYKYKRLEKIVKELNDDFHRTFGSKSAYTKIDVVDDNYISHENDKYRTAKKLARERLLELFDDLLENPLSPEHFCTLMQNVISRDASNKSTNGNQYFSIDGKTVRGGKSNEEKFLSILYAYSAMAELLRFLEENNISIFDVPSTVFRDDKYIRRFTGLREYIEMHDTVVEMVQSGYNPIASLPTNDMLYENLASSKMIDISKIKYISIKDLLEEADLLTASQESVGLPRASEFVRELKLAAKNYDSANNFEEKVIRNLEESLKANGIVLYNKDTLEWLPLKGSVHPSIVELLKPCFINNNLDLNDSNYLYLKNSDAISSDATVIYDAIRYTSLKISVATLVVYMIKELEKVTSKVGYLEYLSKWGKFINLSENIISIYELNPLLSFTNAKLCLTPDEIYENIEGRYLLYFRDIITVYSKFFTRLREYREKVNSELNEHFVGKSGGFGHYKDALENYSATILVNYSDNNITQNLEIFLTIAEVGEYSYVFLKGKPYTKIRNGCKAFLHRKGYWVSPDFVDSPIEPIKELDTFS